MSEGYPMGDALSEHDGIISRSKRGRVSHKELAKMASEASNRYVNGKMSNFDYNEALFAFDKIAENLGCMLTQYRRLPEGGLHSEYVRKVLGKKAKNMSDKMCDEIFEAAFNMMHQEGDHYAGYLDKYIKEKATMGELG